MESVVTATAGFQTSVSEESCFPEFVTLALELVCSPCLANQEHMYAMRWRGAPCLP